MSFLKGQEGRGFIPFKIQPRFVLLAIGGSVALVERKSNKVTESHCLKVNAIQSVREDAALFKMPFLQGILLFLLQLSTETSKQSKDSHCSFSRDYPFYMFESLMQQLAKIDSYVVFSFPSPKANLSVPFKSCMFLKTFLNNMVIVSYCTAALLIWVQRPVLDALLYGVHQHVVFRYRTQLPEN